MVSAGLDKCFVIIGIHGAIGNGLVIGGSVQDEPVQA